MGREGRTRAGVTALAVTLALAGATLVLDLRPDITFRLERAVVCRSLVHGLPMDATQRFGRGVQRVLVWFDGRPGTRATRIFAEFFVQTGGARSLGVQTMLLPAGSDGGVFTLSMRSGEPLPVGTYRAHVKTADAELPPLTFRVGDAPDAPKDSVPGAIECAAEGFSVVPPPGWRSLPVQESALTLVRVDEPMAVLMVVVRRESVAATLDAVVETLSELARSESGNPLLGGGRQVVDGRTAGVFRIDRGAGDRMKVVVVPRERAPASRTYYCLILTGPRAAFARIEAEAAAAIASFRVVPGDLP